MSGYDSEQTLIRLTNLLLERLDEINEPIENYANADFILGAKTAYVECLELVQATWDGERNNIPDDIEKQYPI